MPASRRVSGEGSGGDVNNIITNQLTDDDTLKTAIQGLVSAITLRAGYQLRAENEIYRRDNGDIDIIRITLRSVFTQLPVAQGG